MNGAVGDCNVNSGNSPGSFVQLNSLVNGESQNFWPILAGFGQGVTPVGAAVSLHAQVATVWLGSNDLLKVAFSGGAAPVTAPQSMHDDTVNIIKQLQGAGSKVAVANLVDVMGAATFIPQPAYQPTLQAYITGVLIAQGVPPAQAQAAAILYSTAYAAQETAQTGLGPNGYFTINALFKTLQTAAAQIPAHALPAAPTLGSGDFVADAVANNVKALNAAYNVAIGQAASDTGAALVDVHKLFVQIASSRRRADQPAEVLLLGLPRRAVEPRRAASVEHGLRADRQRVHRHAQRGVQPRHPRRQRRRGVRERPVRARERRVRIQRFAIYHDEHTNDILRCPDARRRALERDAAARRDAVRAGRGLPRSVGEGPELHDQHQGARDQRHRRPATARSTTRTSSRTSPRSTSPADPAAAAVRCGRAATRSPAIAADSSA